jgi:L-ascorbate metabolism protein UlaG (beta-lactamase superfamily)
MNITYLGHSSFRIKASIATIITDPFDDSLGLHFPKKEADIVTVSHHHFDHENIKGLKNPDAFVIDAPGEYEIKEVMVKGISTFHDDKNGEERGLNTAYTMEVEGVHICHLGDLGHELSEKQLKEFEETDILMIPVGGVYTIDPKIAVSVIKAIDPSIVIPMHYKVPGLNDSFAQLATLEDFLSEFELAPTKTDKLVISSSTLPEEMELVVLQS